MSVHKRLYTLELQVRLKLGELLYRSDVEMIIVYTCIVYIMFSMQNFWGATAPPAPPVPTPMHKLLSLLYLHAWRPHVHFQTNPYYVLSTVYLMMQKYVCFIWQNSSCNILKNPSVPYVHT